MIEELKEYDSGRLRMGDEWVLMRKFIEHARNSEA